VCQFLIGPIAFGPIAMVIDGRRTLQAQPAFAPGAKIHFATLSAASASADESVGGTARRRTIAPHWQSGDGYVIPTRDSRAQALGRPSLTVERVAGRDHDARCGHFGRFSITIRVSRGDQACTRVTASGDSRFDRVEALDQPFRGVLASRRARIRHRDRLSE